MGTVSVMVGIAIGIIASATSVAANPGPTAAVTTVNVSLPKSVKRFAASQPLAPSSV